MKEIAILILLILLATSLIMIAFLIKHQMPKNCNDFTTQFEAQVYFEEQNATWLDRNNDHIACNGLLRGGE